MSSPIEEFKLKVCSGCTGSKFCMLPQGNQYPLQPRVELMQLCMLSYLVTKGIQVQANIPTPQINPTVIVQPPVEPKKSVWSFFKRR